MTRFSVLRNYEENSVASSPFRIKSLIEGLTDKFQEGTLMEFLMLDFVFWKPLYPRFTAASFIINS